MAVVDIVADEKDTRRRDESIGQVDVGAFHLPIGKVGGADQIERVTSCPAIVRDVGKRAPVPVIDGEGIISSCAINIYRRNVGNIEFPDQRLDLAVNAPLKNLEKGAITGI